MTLDEAVKIAPLISASVASIAAIAAAGSAAFAARQMLLAGRTAVLQILQSFDKSATDREAAIASANTAEAKEHAFHEFMNHLELYAGVCNRKLARGLAREIIRDRLVDSVVVIERAEHWHQKINQAIFHSDTFNQLRIFAGKNAKVLSTRREAAKKRQELLTKASAN